MANGGGRRNYGSDWSDFPAAETPHFFKIIHSGVSSSKELRIPPKFVKKYGGALLNHRAVFLSVPTGAKWEVELTTSSSSSSSSTYNELWFSNGWEEFKDNYSICHGHFLVFRYDGNSQFHVLIFDTSAAEIDYSSFADAANANTAVQGAQNILNVCSVKQETEDYSTTTADQMMMDHHGSTPEIKQECKTSMLAAPKDLKLQKLLTTPAASAKQKLETFQRTKGFKSKYPHCLVYVQPSYVSPKQTMNIPTQFGRKYLWLEPREVLLKMSECTRTWTAKCYFSTIKYCLRWFSFVKDNKIEAGDVCAFELIENSEPPVFNVTVFRASGMV